MLNNECNVQHFDYSWLLVQTGSKNSYGDSISSPLVIWDSATDAPSTMVRTGVDKIYGISPFSTTKILMSAMFGTTFEEKTVTLKIKGNGGATGCTYQYIEIWRWVTCATTPPACIGCNECFTTLTVPFSCSSCKADYVKNAGQTLC